MIQRIGQAGTGEGHALLALQPAQFLHRAQRQGVPTGGREFRLEQLRDIRGADRAKGQPTFTTIHFHQRFEPVGAT